MPLNTLLVNGGSSPDLTQDIINDVSKQIANTDHYDIVISGLKVNKEYVSQFRWMYEDGSLGEWSSSYTFTTDDETSPNAPSTPVLTAGAGFFKVTWDGKNSANQTMQDVARVNVYVNGGLFNPLVESAFFTEAGSRNIPADSDSYTVTFKAIRSSGKLSSSSASASVDVTIDAGVALASANGKNTIYRQSSQPTGGTYVTGDTWFDTDDDNKIYRYNGTTWVGFTLGNNALESISANKLTAGTIDASVITVSNLDAGNITTGILTGREINNGSGTFRVTAAGALTATSATITGAITATSGSFTGSITAGATIDGTAASTVTSGAASGATALQEGNGVSKGSGNVINSILMNSGGISISTAATGTRMQLNNSGLQLFNGLTRTVFLDGATGTAEFSGKITSSEGAIGGWTIGTGKIYNDYIELQSNNDPSLGYPAIKLTSGSTNYAIYGALGYFSITNISDNANLLFAIGQEVRLGGSGYTVENVNTTINNKQLRNIYVSSTAGEPSPSSPATGDIKLEW